MTVTAATVFDDELRGVSVHHGAARFEGGAVSRLMAGAKVEVKGVLGQDGNTLQANEVAFDD